MKPHQRYKIMVDYLQLKVVEKDWHGVCDAAMDLRELVAKYPEVESTIIVIHETHTPKADIKSVLFDEVGE